jgi:hypothetical protein
MWFPRTAPPARRGTDPERDEKFESGFLQRRVGCELGFCKGGPAVFTGKRRPSERKLMTGAPFGPGGKPHLSCASSTPSSHLEPVEFLLAHRHHWHRAPPRPLEPRAVSRNFAEGCLLYIALTSESLEMSIMENQRTDEHDEGLIPNQCMLFVPCTQAGPHETSRRSSPEEKRGKRD